MELAIQKKLSIADESSINNLQESSEVVYRNILDFNSIFFALKK